MKNAERSVVVTGASTGIGEACARFLDARGFRVLPVRAMDAIYRRVLRSD